MNYRTLRPGDRIEFGDEVLTCDGNWRPVVFTIGELVQHDNERYRRPVVGGFTPRIVREPLLRRILGTLRRIFFR